MSALVAGRFAQADSRRRARMYLVGVLSGAERKNSWTLAEQAGALTSDGMRRLLNFYRWDADAVRDDLRGYVLEHLADPGGVVVADETGFLKKGTKSAGVQRRYSGTAGRIENCQLGVFLAYVSPEGRVSADRELYLPKSWTEDRERCAEAGIGDEVEFATTPVLAARMLQRLLDAGVDVPWSTADEAYGDNPGIADLAGRTPPGLRHGRLVRRPVHHPARPRPGRRVGRHRAARAKAGSDSPPGAGGTGQRLYDWLLLDPGADTHTLSVRRSIGRPAEPAYHVCHTRRPVPLAELVRVAGTRRGAEDTFQSAENETARTTTRSAHTTPGTATPPCPCSPPRSSPSPPTPNGPATQRGHHRRPSLSDPVVAQRDQTPLGQPDPTHAPRTHIDHWSDWRPLHQTRPRHSHYQRQRLKHPKLRL
ncbi:IS701 family transposase [Actinosynnema sp. CA-248983]